jgi:hypothetical protein
MAAVIPSEPKAGLSFRASGSESRNLDFPAMDRLDRVFQKRTQMALIPQMAQIGPAARAELICVI